MEIIMRNELKDSVITIRQHRSDDIDSHYEAVMESRDMLSRYLFWCTPDFSRDGSREWIELQETLWNEGREYNFIIEETAGGRLLGSVGVNRIDAINKTSCIGYWVRQSATGRGIATSAARLAVRFAFEDLDIRRIGIFIHTANKASIRVTEKLGALREGVMRNKVFLHGESCDAVSYSLIPGDVIPV